MEHRATDYDYPQMPCGCTEYHTADCPLLTDRGDSGPYEELDWYERGDGPEDEYDDDDEDEFGYQGYMRGEGPYDDVSSGYEARRHAGDYLNDAWSRVYAPGTWLVDEEAPGGPVYYFVLPNGDLEEESTGISSPPWESSGLGLRSVDRPVARRRATDEGPCGENPCPGHGTGRIRIYDDVGTEDEPWAWGIVNDEGEGHDYSHGVARTREDAQAQAEAELARLEELTPEWFTETEYIASRRFGFQGYSALWGAVELEPGGVWPNDLEYDWEGSSYEDLSQVHYHLCPRGHKSLCPFALGNESQLYEDGSSRGAEPCQVIETGWDEYSCYECYEEDH